MRFRVMLDYKDKIIVEGSSVAQVKQQAKDTNPGRGVTVHELLTLENGVEVVKPNYLSNSSMQKFYKDPTEFALQYTLLDPPERYPQTKQMMFGSAFDGFVKNYLVDKLYDEIPEEYDLKKITESQCDEHFWNKDHEDYDPELDAFVWGAALLEQYKVSGALADLMLMLRNSDCLPKFEFTVTERIVHKDFGECVILGKPDCYFTNTSGAHIIFDFKCNSIQAKKNTSPKKGFVKCSDGWVGGSKQSRDNGQQHRDAILMRDCGVMCNFALKFYDVDQAWSDQTTAYSWLMGSPIGGNLVTGIHQLIGQGLSDRDRELGRICRVRVAQHYYAIDKQYQLDLLKKYCDMWAKVQEGHIFFNLTKEESNKKLLQLTALHSGNEKGSKQEWLSNISREKKYYG